MRILISLRKPDEMDYLFYVKWYPYRFYNNKENSNLKKFIERGLQNMQKGNFLMLCYNKIMEVCDNLFGKHHISILLFEDIKTNKQK